jgi:hypothetical protein
LPGECPDAATELVASEKAETNLAAPGGKARAADEEVSIRGKADGRKAGLFPAMVNCRYFYL